MDNQEIHRHAASWFLPALNTQVEPSPNVAKPSPFGPRGMGLVTFTSDGRMMSVLVDGRASLPEGTPRQYSSYCGNYTFDGGTLTTIVDANCDPVRFTAPQVRKVRFDGERMVLTPPTSEIEGVKVTRELTWERISSQSL